MTAADDDEWLIYNLLLFSFSNGWYNKYCFVHNFCQQINIMLQYPIILLFKVASDFCAFILDSKIIATYNLQIK